MLGLGASLTSSFNSEAAVVIEDYMWEGVSNGGVAGELTPRPTAYDFNDTWDLDVATGGSPLDYMPQIVGDISDEGYWELDGVWTGSTFDGDVQPLDV